MKKTGLLLLLLVLCLAAMGFASAETGPVGQNGAISAYVDGTGKLFLTGRANAINTAPADSIVSADAYRVLFLSPAAAEGTNDLYMIGLADFKETLLARDVHTAILSDEDTAYYVANTDRKQLTRVDLNTQAAAVAYTAAEPIDRLYRSVEGLVVQLVDQAGNLLYVQETGLFEAYASSLPRSGINTEDYEVYLTDEGDLYFRNGFNFSSEFLDGDVLAYAQMNGVVYYLSHAGSAVRLMEYDPALQSTDVVLTPEVAVENQLTASANALFMLGSDNTVYSVDVKKGALNPFKTIGSLNAYGLPAEYSVAGLQIEGMSGQLNVYAKLQEKSAKPDFSFIEFETETEVADPVLRLIEKLPVSGERTAWDELKPVEQYTTLARGSRGDAVRAIQQPLYDLGYYDYYVDGIFGPRTENAVRLLQDDLALTVNGVANADLQRTILSGTLKPYDPYKELARRDRGNRVVKMQEHLRDLGYLADAADGIFGPRTQKAVQLFQKENGMAVNEKATRETLKLLYSDQANRCSSYIDLYPGDTGYRVRELNNRLRDLYYLESNVGSRYTSETTSAVKVFQRTAGLRETGQATVPVLKALFADNAPEAPGYITLRRGDENSRVERLQRRLKELGYFPGPVTGYYGKSTKEAVRLFQMKVGLKPTGVATVRTQQLLFAPDAPIYVPPTVIGVPAIMLDYYDRVDETGAYVITDASSASGYITFSWFAEGEVESYNVNICDQDGLVILDMPTLMNQTGVSVSTLPYGVRYKIEIIAYPADADPNHVTSASAWFTRVEVPVTPEIGIIGNPEISIEPVARVENGVSYLQPGIIAFHWKAEGDVASYYWEIRDESDNIFLSANTTDQQTTVNSSALNQGEEYVIYVYAIPTNGTIDNARVKFMRFALPVVELPSPDPTPEPTPTPTPEPTPEPTPTPENNISAPEGSQSNEPGGAAEPETPAEQPTEEQPIEQPVEEQPAEQPVEEQPAEQPTEEQPAEQPTEEQPAEQPTEEQPAAVSAPALSIEPAVEVTEEGVSIVPEAADTVTVSFPTEGETDGTEVSILIEDQLVTSTTVDSATDALSFHANVMQPGVVYTLKAAPIVNGSVDASLAATAEFTLETPAVEEPPVEEPEVEQPVEQPVEEPVVEQPVEQPVEEPVVEQPVEQPVEEPVVEQAVEQPAEEPVVEQPVEQPVEEPVVEQPVEQPYEEPVVEQPVEQPYEEPVVEEPYEEPVVEEPIEEPVEEPAAAGFYDSLGNYWDAPVDEYADSTKITLIQDRLAALGWLPSDFAATGTLDETTVQAVYSFQSYVNETNAEGLYLSPISTDSTVAAPVIDMDTLSALLGENAVTLYANPNPSAAEGADGGEGEADYSEDDYSEDDYSDDYSEEYAEDGDY